MMRLKVQTLRNLLWLANFVVVLAIAGLLVRIYLGNRRPAPQRMFAYLPNERIEAAMRVERSEDASVRAAARDWPLFASTYTLNVTGKEEVTEGPAVAEEGPAETEIRPIEDVLAVEMMLVAGDQSYARIRYLDEQPEPDAGSRTPAPASPSGVRKRAEARVAESFVVPGDPLRAPYDKAPYEGKVLAITTEGVRFSWGGKEVLVVPPALDRSNIEPRKLPGLGEEIDEEDAVRRAAERAASRPLGPNGWFIGTEELARIREQADELLAQIGVGVTYDRKLRRSLLKLTRVPEDSLVHERGFREGDTILSINGEPVSSKFSIVNYFKQHPDLSTVRVEIERRGQRLVKTFQLAR